MADDKRCEKRRPATAVISYADNNGHRREWRVACILPDDNKRTMQRHFDYWCPNGEFIGVVFEEDGDGE